MSRVERMKPIRIAIIGYGKIAEDQHVPAIRYDRFDLVATSSRSGQGVAQNFTDWRDLIRTVEGLEEWRSPPPRARVSTIARECIAAGLHCLLENRRGPGSPKSPTSTASPGQDVTLFTTWHAQHHSGVEAAPKALAGKRIKSMRSTGTEDVHKWHPGH